MHSARLSSWLQRRSALIVGAILLLLWALSSMWQWRRAATCYFPSGPLSSEQRQRLEQAFRPRMSAGDERDLARTLGQLHERLRDAGVVHFLYSGTLIGSRRHHGLVPWDDDADVLVNYSQIRDVERALGSVPGYELFTGYRWRYKLYPANGSPISGKTWKWPYVDICFFEETATHVIDVDPNCRDYIYPKADVFPLVRRPYEGMMLPAPRRTSKVIAYHVPDESVCATNTWLHKEERPAPVGLRCTAPCSHLYDMYPFVFKSSASAPELLQIGNRTIGEFRPGGDAADE